MCLEWVCMCWYPKNFHLKKHAGKKKKNGQMKLWSDSPPASACIQGFPSSSPATWRAPVCRSEARPGWSARWAPGTWPSAGWKMGAISRGAAATSSRTRGGGRRSSWRTVSWQTGESTPSSAPRTTTRTNMSPRPIWRWMVMISVCLECQPTCL